MGLSILLLLKYKETPSSLFLILMGITAGLSFMCKWTMSLFILIVYLPLIIYVGNGFIDSFKRFLVLLASYFITILPWTLWIVHSFPNESISMLNGLVTPVVSVVQEHKGQWHYYLNAIRIYINELIYLPILFLIFYSFKRLTFNRLLLCIWIFIPLILLSITSTKREVYIMIIAMPVFILFGLFIQYLSSYPLKNKLGIMSKIITYALFILAIRYSIERIKPLKPRLVKPEYRSEIEVFLSENKLISSDSIIVYNSPQYIENRFYYSIKAYRYLDDSTINTLKNKGFKVYDYDKGNFIKR